jgi:hypothetical protein
MRRFSIMEKKPDKSHGTDLPACATEYIGRVVRRMWYRRKARRDVQAELTAHFEDAVRDCTTTEEKERKARELIDGFGDARLLAALCHRAKKRCRPLWLKALVRSGQGLGVVLLYGVVCLLPTLLGRPTIRVNYVEWLSEHWRPAGPGVENAKVYYDKAASAYVAPPAELESKAWARGWKLGDYTDKQVQLMEAWLANNQTTFGALRRGAHAPHYWPVYDANAPAPIETRVIADEMETLKEWRHVTFALKREILWEARSGKVAEALDDCLVLRRSGRHLQGKGSLNGQLVGVSIESLSYDGIMAVVGGANVPPTVLERVQKELTASFDFERQVVDLACEKAIWFDHIQRTFTDDGKGGGHALSEGFVYAPGDWKDNLLNTFRFRYPDRRETVAMVERFFAQAQRRLNAPPDVRDDIEISDGSPGATENIFFSTLAPAYERVALLGWRLKTHESGTITLLAIQRYFQANGSYPDDLEQLAERGLLRQSPKDPFGKGPLTYRKTDREFVLYSWGTDRKDDGGRLGTDNQGLPRNWMDHGDWVFWPVSP